MKTLAVLTLLTILCHEKAWAVLNMDQRLPTTWPANYYSGEYARDYDACEIGYRVNENRQVIHIFNCTQIDSNLFFSLKYKICATPASTGYAESCERVPLIDPEDNIRQADGNCSRVYKGVAPDPASCNRYLLCDDDGLTRVGRRTCKKGQFFNSTSSRCDFFWTYNSLGEIVPVVESVVCGSRPLPLDRSRDISKIMNKCIRNPLGRLDFSAADDLDCQYYYPCETFNPSLVDTSVALRCPLSLYWSDEYQECRRAELLTDEERAACIV